MGGVEKNEILLYNYFRKDCVFKEYQIMKKVENKNNAMLMKMLRERQAKQNISYLTTDSGVYKFFKIMFIVLFIISTVLNLLFVLSEWGSLNANLMNADQLSELQQNQATGIKNGIYSVAIMSFILLFSALFLRLKKPVLQMVFSVIPAIILIFIYAGRLSEALGSGSYSSFIWKHLLPLGLLTVCSIVSAIIHLRQNILDKKGCNEISETIYRRYSVMADSITPEQWEAIMADYKPLEPNSKKRSVKNRIKKENEALQKREGVDDSL